MTGSFCVCSGRVYAGQNLAGMAGWPRNLKQIVLKRITGKKNIQKE